MGLRGATITTIQNLFPERGRTVARAYETNPTFRELCDDYRRCAAAADRWSRRSDAGAKHRSREFTELLVELHNEIWDWLEAMESESARSSGEIDEST